MVTYFLSQHPDVLRRLREEVLCAVGLDSLPTFDDIRQMTYLRAVLNGQSDGPLLPKSLLIDVYRNVASVPRSVSTILSGWSRLGLRLSRSQSSQSAEYEVCAGCAGCLTVTV